MMVGFGAAAGGWLQPQEPDLRGTLPACDATMGALFNSNNSLVALLCSPKTSFQGLISCSGGLPSTGTAPLLILCARMREISGLDGFCKKHAYIHMQNHNFRGMQAQPVGQNCPRRHWEPSLRGWPCCFPWTVRRFSQLLRTAFRHRLPPWFFPWGACDRSVS